MNPYKDNWKTRTTYIHKNTAKNFPYFISSAVGKEQDLVKCHVNDYSLITIIKLLDAVKEEPKTFTNLSYSSAIRMKRSFLNYLNVCVNFKLIAKKRESLLVYYSTTEKGKQFLKLFQEAIL